MRLFQFPYVTLRIACSKCSRKGRYRLARLADRYGSETRLIKLMDMLAADCKLREGKRPSVYDRAAPSIQIWRRRYRRTNRDRRRSSRS